MLETDTETSHYAATVLQDALNEFRNVVDKEYKSILEEFLFKMTYPIIPYYKD